VESSASPDGLAGWRLASGRRESEQRRAAVEDLQRAGRPKARSWLWDGGRMRQAGEETSETCPPLVNMVGYTVEKRERQPKKVERS